MQVEGFARSRGIGIVESILAVFLLSLLALAIRSVFRPVEIVFRKERVMNTMRAIESSILSATEDPTTLRLFRNAPATFNLPIGPHGVFTVNAPAQFFDLIGNNCGARSAACPIELSATYDGSIFDYELAYTLPRTVSGSGTVGSGEKTWTLPSPPIPLDSTIAKLQGADLTACPEGTIPRGLNATGSFECWVVSLAQCPPGTLPKGIKFEDDPLNKQVKATMECSQMRTFQCPSMYSMNKIDLSYMDPERNMASTELPTSNSECIFFARGNISLSADGECPAGIKLQNGQSVNFVKVGGKCEIEDESEGLRLVTEPSP